MREKCYCCCDCRHDGDPEAEASPFLLQCKRPREDAAAGEAGPPGGGGIGACSGSAGDSSQV